MAIRAETIETLLSKIEAPLAYFFMKKQERDPNVKYCKLYTDCDNCETMMFGSALQRLIQLGLYPVPAATDYKESISTLKGKVFSIEYKHWEGRDYVPHKSHHICNLGLNDSVLEVVENMAIPLESSDLAHLNQQSTISGIENEKELAAFHSTLRPTAEEFKVASKSEPEKSPAGVKIETIDESEIDVAKNKDTQDVTESADGSNTSNDSNESSVTIKEEKIDEEA
jgi:hypothetical protein